MQKAEIRPRAEYAFREKRVAGGPIERVRVLEHIRGNKWKPEWIEPNPGLMHYVESGQLLCPWKERKAFLKEEENRERLIKRNDEYTDRQGKLQLPFGLTGCFPALFPALGPCLLESYKINHL